MPPNKTFLATLVDLPGSDDVVLELAPEMLDGLEWREGDVLELEVTGNRVVIRNVSRAERRF